MGMAQNFDAVNVRHFDVGNDEIVESAVDFILGRLPGLHSFDAVTVAAQSDVEHFADGALVVADQDISHATSLGPLRPVVAGALASVVRRCYRPPECCRSGVRHRTAAAA